MQNTHILPGTRIVGNALFFEHAQLLSLADLQLGYEDLMTRQGVLVPRFNFREIAGELKKLLQETRPRKLLVNGDVKQAFAKTPRPEWQEAAAFFSLAKELVNEIIIVEGNHDRALEPIARAHGLKLVAEHYLAAEKTLFVHGHKIPDSPAFQAAETIVVGHEHPAIKIRDGAKTETFKCFLKGNYAGKTLVVQPSFTPTRIGTDVGQGTFLSPFLAQGIGDFEVWVFEDKPYYFGRVKEIPALAE